MYSGFAFCFARSFLVRPNPDAGGAETGRGEPIRDPGPRPPIQVQVNEVIVPVTVTDEKGRFVSDLDQKDFTVFEEGKEQQIQFFTRERSQPVVVGFLIDLSNASRLHWKNYQDAAVELVQNLIPGDNPKFSGYLIGYSNTRRTGGGHHHRSRADGAEAPKAEAQRRIGAVRRHLYGLHQPQADSGRADRAAARPGDHRRRARQRQQEDAGRSAGDRAAESGDHLWREHGGVRFRQRGRQRTWSGWRKRPGAAWNIRWKTCTRTWPGIFRRRPTKAITR